MGGYPLEAGFLQLMGEGSPAAAAGIKHVLTAPGVTEFDFADGSRLVVKATQYSPGSASVVGLVGNGRLGLPDPLAGVSWATAFLPLGGTQSASYEQIEHWLNAAGHDRVPWRGVAFFGHRVFRRQFEPVMCRVQPTAQRWDYR
jgi:hypothetical protein